MNYDTIKFSPWGDLLVERYKKQQIFENRQTKTEADLMNRLRKSRKALLGTGRSLSILISDHGTPDDLAIETLGTWLTSYATAFCRTKDGGEYEEFFRNFFRFGLHMYAYDDIQEECIDDLILLANCYVEEGPEIYWRVVRPSLPDDLGYEFDEWMNVDPDGYGHGEEYPQAPRSLETHVTATVAALLGAMREPKANM